MTSRSHDFVNYNVSVIVPLLHYMALCIQYDKDGLIIHVIILFKLIKQHVFVVVYIF